MDRLIFTKQLSLMIAIAAGLTHSVVAQHAPVGESHSETAEVTIQSIESLVADALANDDLLKRERFTVTSRDGIVTLSGEGSSLSATRRASRIAKQVRGVRSVVDQTMVKGRDLDDDTVAACVRRALTVDPVTEKAEIAVAVDSGEVGLAGSVSSLAEKRIAEEIVADVWGVTNVVNQLVVTLDKPRSDAELQPEIQRLIDNAIPLGSSQVEVTVDDGKVTLTGSINSRWQEDLLLQMASVRGVSMVTADDLEVDGGKNDFQQMPDADRDDPSIQETVRLAFASDPLVHSFTDDIDVKVDQGMVTLTGSVSRVRVKRAAEAIAKNTVGVRSVNNQLNIAWSGSHVSDEQIIREAQAAIKRSSYLQHHEIRVHCHDAHLHLYGIVDSEREKQIASWTLDGLKGVVHVGNRLAVASEWEPKEDQTIQSDLQQKLAQSLLADAVSVDVIEGVAILRGEVDSWNQWQATLNMALDAGARKPHSLIKVRGHSDRSGTGTFVP